MIQLKFFLFFFYSCCHLSFFFNLMFLLIEFVFWFFSQVLKEKKEKLIKNKSNFLKKWGPRICVALTGNIVSLFYFVIIFFIVFFFNQEYTNDFIFISYLCFILHLQLFQSLFISGYTRIWSQRPIFIIIYFKIRLSILFNWSNNKKCRFKNKSVTFFIN